MLRTRAVRDDASSAPAAPAARPAIPWRPKRIAPVAAVAALVSYLALTPLAPFALDPVAGETRRHLILAAVFVCYGLYLVISRTLPRGTALDLPILAVYGAIALAVWGSLDRRTSLEWLLVVLPVAPLFVIVRDRRLFARERLRQGMMVGTIIVAVPALVSVWRQWHDWLELVRTVEGGLAVGNLLPPTVPRVAGVGSHPNVLAAVLALALPFFVASFTSTRRVERAGAGLGLLVVGAALFFTLSRAAWAGAALGCLVTGGVLFGGHMQRLSRRSWVLAGLGVLVVGVLGALVLGGARPDWLYRDSLNPRADMRRVGWEIARDNPLTGTGPNLFPLMYAAHHGVHPFAAVHAHNTAVQIAADTGIVGLAAATVLAGTTLSLAGFAIFGRSVSRRREAAIPAGTLTAFLVHGLADSPHLYPDVLLVLAVAAAMLPLNDGSERQEPPGKRRMESIRAGLSGSGLVLLIGIGAVLLPLWWWNDRGAALHQKAVGTTAANRHDVGIRMAEQAVAWDGMQIAHRMQLAAALSSRYGREGDPLDRDRAIVEYELVLARQPYLATALVDLASLRLDRGDLTGAREAVARLGRLTGGDRLLQVAHAVLVEQTGTPEQAIDTYAGLLAIDPTLAATPFFGAGFRQEFSEQIVERALARAAELAPPGAALETRRTAILVFAGRAAPDEAVVRRALAVDPDSTDTLVALGRLLLASGRVAEAESPLRRAVERTSDSAGARQALGDWYAAAGKRQAARHEWMIAAWLGDPRGLDALGESYPPGAVPPALIARQQQLLAAWPTTRFELLAQNFRFSFLRQEPAPIIAQGDWLLALPNDYYRWSANVDRWRTERSASR